MALDMSCCAVDNKSEYAHTPVAVERTWFSPALLGTSKTLALKAQVFLIKTA